MSQTQAKDPKLILNSESIYSLLSEIPDPEIPVISIADLGVLRSVDMENENVIVKITPTYSGCPALEAIEDEIRKTLLENGIKKFEVKTVHSPAWTTDWLNDDAKEKLRVYGISPPNKLKDKISVACPRCNSKDVTLVSFFGSTACKSLYKCNSCLEPFDQFKCH